MTEYGQSAGEILDRIRKSKPVVHSITNYVVMNSTANVLLAMGAAPIMAHAPEEMEDLSLISSSLVINIGTLSKPWIESMHLAARLAARMNKPFLLDPVGSGASKLRTETAKSLIASSLPTVIRGNASEILSLSPQGGTTRGVDSIHSMEDAIEAAGTIARSLGTVIAVTGRTRSRYRRRAVSHNLRRTSSAGLCDRDRMCGECDHRCLSGTRKGPGKGNRIRTGILRAGRRARRCPGTSAGKFLDQSPR